MPNYFDVANEEAVEIMQGLKAGTPAPAGNFRLSSLKNYVRTELVPFSVRSKVEHPKVIGPD